MAMGDLAWMSVAFADTRHLRPFTNDFEWSMDPDKLAEISSRVLAGAKLNAEEFPKTIWGSKERGAKTFKTLPDLMYGFGFWVVSQRVADVMRQFDLGCGSLHPVEVLQKDKKTPVADHAWFCLDFGNRKQALVRDQSKNLKPWPGERWTIGYVMEDDDVAVSHVALEGPDVWIDPQLHDAFFLSGPLGTALKKAKAASGFGLKRCHVV
jgi:hypothetical protein